jgi:hypothetical protein
MLFYKTIKESLISYVHRYIFMAEPRSSLRTCMSMLRSLDEYLEIALRLLSIRLILVYLERGLY